MTRAVLFAVAACFAAGSIGCSEDSAPPPPQQPVVVATDAGTLASTPPTGNPDEATGRTAKSKPRTARTIDIMLRSTPPGARAIVGDDVVGDTPTMWSGEPDGKPVDFVFTLPGHAPARYRFIPITSGLVHARLEPFADTTNDAGLGPQIAPKQAPDAAVAPPPVAPIDAAPRTEPADATAPEPPRGPTP